MSYLSEVLLDSPVHYWRCADPSGELLHDLGSSPRALGLNTGGAGLYTGPTSGGGAVLFANGRSAIYRDTDLTLATPFTLECWFWQMFRNATAQDFLTALDVAGTAVGIGVVAGGQAHAYSTSGSITGATVPSIQHWHHLVLTASVAANILYLDSIVQVTAAGAAFSLAAQLALAFGGTPASPVRFASAVLSECAIYPSALSASRVSAHYLAANNTLSRPVFQNVGTWDSSTGSSVLGTDNSAAILAAVRKTFV